MVSGPRAAGCASRYAAPLMSFVRPRWTDVCVEVQLYVFATPTWMRVCLLKPMTPLASRYVPHAHTAPSSVRTHVWLSPARQVGGSQRQQGMRAVGRQQSCSSDWGAAADARWGPTAGAPQRSLPPNQAQPRTAALPCPLFGHATLHCLPTTFSRNVLTQAKWQAKWQQLQKCAPVDSCTILPASLGIATSPGVYASPGLPLALPDFSHSSPAACG